VTALVLLSLAATAPAGAAAGSAAPEEPAAEARAALSAGDPARAAEIAGRALAAGDAGAAAGELALVLGLARFREGRYDDALAAFDQAAGATEPPPAAVLAFNRGSALYKLRRFAEAEQLFLRAAGADPHVAALALLDAGLAALDAGSPERARAHLARLEALARGGGADAQTAAAELRDEVVAEEDARSREQRRALRQDARAALRSRDYQRAARLYEDALENARRAHVPEDEEGELAYALGFALYRAGRFAEARARFAEAIVRQPREGEFHLLAGLTAYILADDEAAIRELEAALALGLSTEDRQAAERTLDTLTPGLRARGPGIAAAADLGAGYDSDVPQANVGRTETLAANGGSPFATASFALTDRFLHGRRAVTEIAYLFDQIAYTETRFDDFSLQQQTLAAEEEVRIQRRWRLGLRASGDLLFAGIEHFRRFLDEVTLRPSVAFDEARVTGTRLDVAETWKWALDPTAPQFGGRRTDVLLSQELRGRRARGSLALRFRDEAIGTEVVPLTELPDVEASVSCTAPSCQGTYYVPYNYRSGAVIAGLTVAATARLRLDVGADFERRIYATASFLEIQRASGVMRERDTRIRRDNQLEASIAASARLGAHASARLRYDVTLNRSNIDNTRPNHALDYANKNYLKHIISLELDTDW
jgi:tetratricopeptide (TPR) repeat protein